jgi:hypothetical protein
VVVHQDNDPNARNLSRLVVDALERRLECDSLPALADRLDRAESAC